MKLVINGRERVLDASQEQTTVAQVLQEVMDVMPGRGVAVALEDQVVPRGRWEEVTVTAGDRLEIIGAVQGG